MLLFSLLLFWAHAHTCAHQLVFHEDEQKLSDLLHQMHRLKCAETTEDSIGELDQLNCRALGVMKQRLDLRGIESRITRFPVPIEPLAEADVRPRWNMRLREVEDELRSLETVRGAVHDLPDLERKIAFKKAEIETLRQQTAASREALVHGGEFGLRHALGAPLIVIDDGPTLPEPLRAARPLIGHRNLVLSPQYRSLYPSVRASVHAGHVFYPVEQVFSPNFGRDRSLRHEAVHLDLGDALARGTPGPYYVVAEARRGREFPVSPRTDYHDRIDFGELRAFAEDLENVERDAGDRMYANGRVYRQGPLPRVRFDLAQKLWGLTRLCEQILDHLQSVEPQFEIGATRSRATVAWAPYADIDVYLLGLNTKNQTYRRNHYDVYLDLVREVVQKHQRRALQVLAEYGNVVPPGEVWVEVRQFVSR